MVFGFFRILVRHVQAHVVQAMYFHFLVDGTGHDVAWGEAKPLVVFLHELFAIGQPQDAAVSPHGLCDEVSRVRLARMEEGRGVELHELHAFHRTFGTVDHGDAVACGNVGVGCSGVDGSRTTGSHQSDFGEESIYLLGIRV